jgi:hypothetical protein
MTKTEIAQRLRALSADMIEIGAAMDYYGGFGEMAAKGRELVGAGHIAIDWAENIENEAAADKNVSEFNAAQEAREAMKDD